MAGIVKIDITESAEELQTVMTSQSTASECSKVQVLWWLKTGQVTTVTQAAAQGGHHRTTVSRWLSKYRDGGLEHLLAPPYRPGRPTAIDGELLVALERELADPEGFQSYGEIQHWLSVVHGQEIPYKTVHQTVRYRLKAKLKVPRPVSERQSQGAVDAFKQTSRPK